MQLQPLRRWSTAHAALLAIAILSGCAGPHADRLLQEVASAPAVSASTSHKLYVVTTRARASDPAILFDRTRSEHLTPLTVTIEVPPVHTTGRVERPRGGAADPAKHFVASEIGMYTSNAAASAALRADFRRNGGRALVFVHGYRTHFDSAVYRMAQIVHDGQYTGTPILFSWASSGRTLDYVYDKDSATVARDALEATLRQIAASGATRIDLVAHSMGGWLAMEALRNLAMTGNPDLGGRLSDVVLASPDIDVDIFRAQMRRIGVPKRPYFLLYSGDDKALRISSLIAGNRPRVGDYSDAASLAKLGVIAVNVSGVKAGDGLNHTRFADNPVLIRMLGERLTDPAAFEGDDDQIANGIDTLAGGVLSAGELVVTTPFRVLRIAFGG